MSLNHISRPNSRFNNVANEVLRTGTPKQNQMMMPGYQQPFANPYPPSYGFNINNGFVPYQMPFYPQPMVPAYNDDSDDDAEFEVMVKLIDKQRDILGRFITTLNRNKETLMKDKAKEMTKKIKVLEKESVVRQLKLDGEQDRLIKKLRAPYEFDQATYQLNEVTDSEDEDDDEVLLELLSNKVHFKKMQSLIKKKKLGKKLGQVLKKSRGSSPDDTADGSDEDGTRGSTRQSTQSDKGKRKGKKKKTGKSE